MVQLKGVEADGLARAQSRRLAGRNGVVKTSLHFLQPLPCSAVRQSLPLCPPWTSDSSIQNCLLITLLGCLIGISNKMPPQPNKILILPPKPVPFAVFPITLSDNSILLVTGYKSLGAVFHLYLDKFIQWRTILLWKKKMFPMYHCGINSMTHS